MANLSENSSGIISKTDLQEHLDHTAEELNHYIHAKEIGWEKYMRQIQKLIIKQGLQETKGKVRPLLRSLKLSSSSFYRLNAGDGN